MIGARKLTTRMVEKVWGRDVLPAPFSAPAGQRIGEIWFEPPPEMDGLLVKYLFTSEKLSVQVHPSDAQAPAGHRGKEECWLVLDAEPDARLAIGFHGDIDDQAMLQAALDGSIEDLLVWHKAQAGDFFYLTPGTVHAIGPGLSLIEIQQNSDITYRLFDYGRPRELHLDEAVAVAHGYPHDAALRRPLGRSGTAQLVEGPHFRLDRIAGAPAAEILSRYKSFTLIMPLEGTVQVDGLTIEAGECGIVADLGVADFSAAVTTLVSQPV